MSSRLIKWFILWLPTVTVACWEYIRHQWLLPYISMETGNWLTAVIVLIITWIFIPKLFRQLETIQDQLQQSQLAQAALKEREQLARELHDGIAQSLFLLSVKVDQLQKKEASGEEYQNLKQTIREVNEYVRQAIANLRYPRETNVVAWLDTLQQLIRDFRMETGIPVYWEWNIPDDALSVREKVDLYAAIRESLQNIRKHAEAEHVWIRGNRTETGGWRCVIQDDGKGFSDFSGNRKDRFGLQIMRDRAEALGWTLHITRRDGLTSIEIYK